MLILGFWKAHGNWRSNSNNIMKSGPDLVGKCNYVFPSERKANGKPESRDRKRSVGQRNATLGGFVLNEREECEIRDTKLGMNSVKDKTVIQVLLLHE